MNATAVSDPTRIEYLALARTLRVTPEDIGYLSEVSAPELRQFRLQVVRTLSRANRAGLERIASSASLVPASVSAKVTQRTESTLFVARMAGVVDQTRVAEVGRRLPPALLAQIAAHMDPAALVQLVSEMSAPQLQRVVEELCARADWLTLAGIASERCSTALREALNVGLGPSDLLRVAHLVYDREKLGALVGRLGDGDIGSLVHVASTDDLWTALAHVCAAFTADQRASAIRHGRLLDDDDARRLAMTATAGHGVVGHVGLPEKTTEPTESTDAFADHRIGPVDSIDQ